jgi:hypothetical protein
MGWTGSFSVRWRDYFQSAATTNFVPLGSIGRLEFEKLIFLQPLTETMSCQHVIGNAEHGNTWISLVTQDFAIRKLNFHLK